MTAQQTKRFGDVWWVLAMGVVALIVGVVIEASARPSERTVTSGSLSAVVPAGWLVTSDLDGLQLSDEFGSTTEVSISIVTGYPTSGQAAAAGERHAAQGLVLYRLLSQGATDLRPEGTTLSYAFVDPLPDVPQPKLGREVYWSVGATVVSARLIAAADDFGRVEPVFADIVRSVEVQP